MRPRERIHAALAGDPTDRVPHNFRAWGNVQDDLVDHLGLPDRSAVLEWAGSDVRDLGGLGSFLRPDVRLEPNTDIWGVRREVVSGEAGSYAHIAHSPLAEARGMDDLDCYAFPDAGALFDFSDLPGHARRLGREGHYFLFTEVESVFDRTWAVRGMENFLVDLIESPDLVDAMLERNATFFCERTRMLLEAGEGLVDCVGLFNDFGTQHGLLVSPGMYRRFVKEHQRRLVAMAHDHGAKVFYHSCGCVSELWDDLLEIGVDILDPLQLPALGLTPEQVRQTWPAVNFHGGLDTQTVLPFGTPEEVRAEVDHLAEALSREGHYILSTSHNLQGGVPMANLVAMVEALREA